MAQNFESIDRVQAKVIITANTPAVVGDILVRGGEAVYDVSDDELQVTPDRLIPSPNVLVLGPAGVQPQVAETATGFAIRFVDLSGQLVAPAIGTYYIRISSIDDGVDQATALSPLPTQP